MARGTINTPAPSKDLGLKLALRNQLKLMAKGMSDDFVLVVTPATDTPAPTAAAWTQDVYVELQTAAGETHTWFNKTITSGHSITDDSTAGTATCSPATTTTYVDGVCKITISGDAQAWLNGETVTLTVAAITSPWGATIAAKTCVLTFTTP